jgi:DNA-binding GntR family transcriptional regulator
MTARTGTVPSAARVMSAREEPKTKTDVAYETLRRAIVTGQIGTDEPLDENVLITRFDLGRTPLREALKRLALEQFVSWPSHSTPFVRGVSAQELAWLFQARLILEEPASRIATERMSDAELDSLDELSVNIEECIASGHIYEAVEFDHALHLAIAQGSGNRYLAQAVSHLNCGSLRLWYVTHERLKDQTSTARHSELISALRSRDPERAAVATRKHILRSQQRQLTLQQLDMNRTAGLVTGMSEQDA